MSNLLELCFIGKTTKCNDCHKTWYKKEKGFKRLTELSYVEQQLLLWRCGLDINNLMIWLPLTTKFAFTITANIFLAMKINKKIVQIHLIFTLKSKKENNISKVNME